MPLNASGKLDRRAIRDLVTAISPPDRQPYLSTSEEVGVEPATPLQRELQNLWATALRVPVSQINLHDNFFQIGGDSVVAMRMVASAAGRELQVTVADLFQQPRLVDLAERLSTRLQAESTETREDADPERFSLWLGVDHADEAQVQGQLQEIAKQCGTAVEKIQDVYPCTPLQQGLMAITGRQSSAYVNRQTFTLDPGLDLDRFQDAWRTLVAVMPILRTRIVVGSESATALHQVVLDEEIVWHHSSSLEDYLRADQQEEMGLGTPLARYGLVNDQESGGRFFVWTAHHSLYDGWSTLLLYRHLATIFQTSDVPSSVPFTRFLRFLRDQEEEEENDNGRAQDRAAYWTHQLQGDVMSNWPPLPHVDYRPRPGLERTRQVSLPAHGSGGDTVTASNVLRAAWALLMAQYSGHDDVIFAATVSGRNAPVQGIESIVAPTITTVPVRVHIDWTQEVTSFLAAVQEQAAQMIDYEHTGLQTIKALIPPESVPALDLRNVLVVQTADEADALLQFPGVRPLTTSGAGTEFDSHALTVDCTLSPTDLRVAIRYDEHIVPTPQVDRILAHLIHLVQQLYNPACVRSRRLGELNLISPADQQLIIEHNAQVDISRVDGTIHELFRNQVHARANAPAVCAWDGDLTYQELFDEAVRLAHFLVSIGVGPEMKVGLCMDKSRWAIVAMLGTLFAGGVIVPLGVTHPLSRIGVIVHDTAADVILVDEEQHARLSPMALPIRLIVVDASLRTALPVQTSAPSTTVSPDNAAWIIYTSGSTGTPKGVVLEHGGLCTSMQTQARKMKITSETRALQFSPFTFDVSISDVSATLIYGGCVCIPSESDRLNALAATICRMQVNFASLTPTVARLLSPADAPSLRTLALTGEALTPEVIALWNQPGVAIYNTYGPSEGSVCTANGPLSRPEEALAIGTPMATRHWVVHPHSHHQLCPIGAPGELLIEGPLMAREYLNNPQKTAAAFVVPPAFLSLPSGYRIYRTGDLVCQHADGSFTYLGRRDTQVKIRGQRVEIGEIEHQIMQQLADAQTSVVHLL
ncbi:amino acid adenylation, partial [Aspergillus japonicus CBS 114.51]